jgi:hypothetical protein
MLAMLPARYDSGSMLPAIFKTIPELEIEVSWAESRCGQGDATGVMTSERKRKETAVDILRKPGGARTYGRRRIERDEERCAKECGAGYDPTDRNRRKPHAQVLK